MIAIKQDPATRRWGYEIREGIDGSGHLGTRVLDSSFEGFEAPNAVIPFVQAMQKSFLEGKYKLDRDRSTGFYGYQSYYEKGPGQFELLTEEYGWQTLDEAQIHVNALIQSLKGEFKIESAKPLVPFSKKALPVTALPAGFKIDTDNN